MPAALTNSRRENAKISARFRRFRRVNLLRQEDLAELMGVTTRTVQNVETGAFGVSAVVIRKFRDAQRSVKAGVTKAGRQLTRVPR